MPEGAQDKLSYTRGVVDKIRASYEKLGKDELLDLLCYVSKTYIVEQTIPFDVPLPERDEEPEEALPDAALEAGRAAADPDASPARRFAQLVLGLKKRSQLPQLEQFTVEDGRAVLTVDNQKIVFGERITVEFVPTRSRPRPAGEARPTPEPAASAPREEPPPPGARPGLPGGDGRARQGGAAPFAPEAPRAAPGVPAPARPDPRPLAPPPKNQPGVPAKNDKKNDKESSPDLTDVDHIVERFRRLDLD